MWLPLPNGGNSGFANEYPCFGKRGNVEHGAVQLGYTSKRPFRQVVLSKPLLMLLIPEPSIVSRNRID